MRRFSLTRPLRGYRRGPTWYGDSQQQIYIIFVGHHKTTLSFLSRYRFFLFCWFYLPPHHQKPHWAESSTNTKINQQNDTKITLYTSRNCGSFPLFYLEPRRWSLYERQAILNAFQLLFTIRFRLFPPGVKTVLSFPQDVLRLTATIRDRSDPTPETRRWLKKFHIPGCSLLLLLLPMGWDHASITTHQVLFTTDSKYDCRGIRGVNYPPYTGSSSRSQ